MGIIGGGFVQNSIAEKEQISTVYILLDFILFYFMRLFFFSISCKWNYEVRFRLQDT